VTVTEPVEEVTTTSVDELTISLRTTAVRQPVMSKEMSTTSPGVPVIEVVAGIVVQEALVTEIVAAAAGDVLDRTTSAVTEKSPSRLNLRASRKPLDWDRPLEHPSGIDQNERVRWVIMRAAQGRRSNSAHRERRIPPDVSCKPEPVPTYCCFQARLQPFVHRKKRVSPVIH
jgi:hypothetical protein